MYYYTQGWKRKQMRFRLQASKELQCLAAIESDLCEDMDIERQYAGFLPWVT